jgi:hypothetical protein
LNKVLVDAVLHSEHEKEIKCDFKPGSVERSIDLNRGMYLSSSRQYIHTPLPMTIEKFHSGIPFVSYLDGIRDILKAQFIMQLW